MSHIKRAQDWLSGSNGSKQKRIYSKLARSFVKMSNLYAVLLFVAVCLACDLDLHYRVNNGDYLIVNPDSDTYNGIQAFDASGDECTTAVIEVYGFTVTGCGLVDVQVDLLTNDSVATSCTISSAGAEMTQNGVSLPIGFVLQSNSLLRSGSAHYHCNVRVTGSTVLVKNPRSELYAYARAQAADGNECTTSFQLDNQVIEISECDVEGQVVLLASSQPITDGSFRITRQIGIFPIDCSGIPPAPVITNSGDNNGMSYSCYDDGSIVAVNPRTELFCHSYAEQNGVVCDSTYVKAFSQVIISGCSHEQPIVLLLSKIPINENALVIRPNNIFLIDCSA